MATIDLATLEGAGMAPAADSLNKTYVLEKVVDIAAAVTAKGSALAAADVIEVLNVPYNSLVLGGTIKVTEATTGTATDLTIDVGDDGDADRFVDGFDLDGATVGAVSGNGVQIGLVTGEAAQTVDITLATMTGTLLTGKVLVSVVVADISDRGTNVGLTTPGS